MIIKAWLKSICKFAQVTEEPPAASSAPVISPEEQEALKSPYAALKYALSLGKRWEPGEPLIARSPVYALEYAQKIIKGPWSLGERSILQDPNTALKYAIFCKNKDFILAEVRRRIKTNTWSAQGVDLFISQNLQELIEMQALQEIVQECRDMNNEEFNVIGLKYAEKAGLQEDELSGIYSEWIMKTLKQNWGMSTGLSKRLISIISHSKVAAKEFEKIIEAGKTDPEIQQGLNSIAEFALPFAAHTVTTKEANQIFHRHWRESSTSISALGYSLAISKVFGNNNIAERESVEFPREVHDKLPSGSMEALASHIKKTYNITQKDIGRADLEDELAVFSNGYIELYRGVASLYAVPYALESWTSSKEDAEIFSGCIMLKARVPTKAILSSHTSSHWGEDAHGEHEYIVIRNLLPNSSITIYRTFGECTKFKKDKGKTLPEFLEIHKKRMEDMGVFSEADEA